LVVAGQVTVAAAKEMIESSEGLTLKELIAKAAMK
jgi:hypothetical protein